MVIPISKEYLETERVFWKERLRIAQKRLASAGSEEHKLAAVKDIRDARSALRSLKNVMRLSDIPLRPKTLDSERVALAEARIKAVLKPQPSKPKPDRKGKKRFRDMAIRTKMKGTKLSDDSRGHGSKRQKKQK